MSTSIAVFLAAVCLNPVDDTAVETVDLVEVNHFYDDQGRLVFDQIIYYDWDAEQSRYNVRDWRLIKTPTQIPLRNWSRGGYVSEWHDFKQRDGLRRVRAKSARESWTQYDPELIERDFLPQEKRRELRKIPLPAARAKRAGRSPHPGDPRPARSGY